MAKFKASAYNKSVVSKSKTYDVELPSGFTFTLRRPNLQAFAASGVVPSYLLEKMFEAEKGNAMPIEMDKIESKDAVKALAFMGLLIRSVCVVPQIVDVPQTEEQIAFEDLSDADVQFIFAWCQGVGGVEGENLEKFRRSA